MPAPLLSEVLPDLVEEIAYLLKQTMAAPLEEQVRQLRIESICDCGDENCASFATAPEVKVLRTLELEAMEGHLIIDLNSSDQICFIEVLSRPDVKYLLEEYYDSARR
jgi:hypothetical protein